jgi:hypothetical protein
MGKPELTEIKTAAKCQVKAKLKDALLLSQALNWLLVVSRWRTPLV